MTKEQILVLVDHKDGVPRKASLEAVSAARHLAASTDRSVGAVWLGPGVSAISHQLGGFGASTVYHWDSDEVFRYVTVPQVEALEVALAVSGSSTLIFPSVNRVKDIAARLAIRCNAGVITDCSSLSSESDGQVVATKEVFGGQMTTRSQIAAGKMQFFGLAPNTFKAERLEAEPPDLIGLSVSLSDNARAAEVVAEERPESTTRPDVAEADVVVAGGRGLGSEEGFRLLERLADLFGGGVGASRVATDSGWYPHRNQVGQTGRTISPSLYIGCGISGAIQHRAGMQTSGHIVVINKDPEAPLFEIADFGIVGDLHTVVPQLIELVKAESA